MQTNFFDMLPKEREKYNNVVDYKYLGSHKKKMYFFLIYFRHGLLDHFRSRSTYLKHVSICNEASEKKEKLRKMKQDGQFICKIVLYLLCVYKVHSFTG